MKVKSINTVITVLIAVIIAVTVASGIWWVSGNTAKTVMNEEKIVMQSMVRQTMTALDDYIDQSGAMARMIASQQVVVDALRGHDPLGAEWLFKDLIEGSDGYWAAFCFDKRGVVLAGYNADGAGLVGADKSSQDYVQVILSGSQESHLSNDIFVSESNGNVLSFAATSVVYDHNGAIIGGVAIFPKWEYFTSRFVDPFRVAMNGYGYMLDVKGRIIAHAVNKDLFLKDLSKFGFVQTALKNKNGDTWYDWEGRRKYMVYEAYPKTGWIMVMSAYEDDMRAAATTQRNRLAAGGSVVAILLVFVMVFMIRRLVTDPVTNILEYASDVARGNLHATLEGKYRFEFEGLSRQIESMVQELKYKLGFSDGVLKGLALPCLLLGPDYKLMWTNKYMLDLIERSGKPEDYVGFGSGQFYYDDPKRETLSDKAIRKRQQLENEIEFTPASGTLKNVHVVTTPFYDMDGELLGSLTVWVDRTEIRGQQRHIEEQNARISRTAVEAEEVSHRLSSAAEELSAQIEQAKNGSDTQRHRVQETSTAMEEMNITVLEVARNASSAAEEADTAKRNAQDGEEIVSQMIKAVGDVQAQADNLKISMEELGRKQRILAGFSK